jgi:hypothetical protein
MGVMAWSSWRGMTHKLLERLILQCIRLWFIKLGSGNHGSCTEQVMELTTHIETGFQSQLKSGEVFVDLYAAYATVWRYGLMLKFMRTVPCEKISNLLNNML